jgi:hypothetical protein
MGPITIRAVAAVISARVMAVTTIMMTMMIMMAVRYRDRGITLKAAPAAKASSLFRNITLLRGSWTDRVSNDSNA